MRPRLRDVLGSLVCLIRGCDLFGQFCDRCGRFVP